MVQSKTSDLVKSDDDSLLAFDLAFQTTLTEGLRPSQLKKAEEECLRRIILIANKRVNENDDLEDQTIDLLGANLDVEKKRLIAVCFLRLLQGPAVRWISQMPWRPRVVSLFDSQFARDIYWEKKVYDNLMAHEKVEKVTLIVKENEQKYQEALQILTSLDRVNAHRAALQQAINNKVGKNVILPFLPDTMNSQLGELYQRVERYIDLRQDHLSIGDAHDRVTRQIERLMKQLDSRPTQYSQWLNEAIAKLQLLISEDFTNNVAAQPGKVSIEVRDSKKYPFHIVGQVVDLAFNLKNEGPGYAYNIHLEVLSDDGIKLHRDEVEVGVLAPTSMQLIEIRSTVVRECQEVYVLLKAVWNNFDHTPDKSEWEFTINAQRSDVNWDKLAQTDPYSLEPVTSERELIGRRNLLNRLIATFKASSVGSSIIQGQKRVGKTSLARALQSHLESLDYLVFYLEAGDYTSPEEKNAVASLGVLLCKGFLIREPRVAHLSIPEFTVALSPLAEFLDSVTRIIPNLKVVFILDEFDGLPVNLYERGPVGDAFFLTLRSLTSRPGIGFALVGGEKMRHIKESQGDKLNKWNVLSVDYFTRESDWTDYCDLIQRPVPELEYANDALILLHELTAGNPYFTKLICKHLFLTLVERRDSHVTPKEVEMATETAVAESDSVAFQHFWEDGITDVGVQKAERSVRRRKILIAVSDVIEQHNLASAKAISKHPLVQSMETLDIELQEFVNRNILVQQENAYRFKVPLFAKWLKGRGVQELIVSSPHVDASLKQRQAEESLKIKAEEIRTLVEKWGPYQGQDLTEQRVRKWLEQFGSARDQRMIFPVLQNLRFYTNGFIKKRMIKIHDFVKKGTIHSVERGKQKRADILATYINGSKNGFLFARQYIEEASIYVGNVVEGNNLVEAIRESRDIKAIVHIVNFVDTSEFAWKDLLKLNELVGDVVREHNIRFVFASILGFELGWKLLEDKIKTLDMPVHAFCSEMLDDSAKCFGEQSSIFDKVEERQAAKKMAREFGGLLKKNWPLGYGDMELAVVFEQGCPNTTLPILWAESQANAWTPLFKTEDSMGVNSDAVDHLHEQTHAEAFTGNGVINSRSFRDWAGAAQTTLAIIFTDVVGNTSISRSIGNEGMKAVRHAHFKQARSLIYKYDGKEIKTIGDAFMVAFRTAVAAFDFALTLSADTGDQLIQIRAGIHVGPVDIEDGDAFGQMVDYTARVGSYPAGPEIFLSEIAKDHIEQEKAKRHDELSWQVHPTCELKGVEKPQRLWSVVRSE